MYPDLQLLVHLCQAEQWQSARPGGLLEPESLRTAGFVHLSSPRQVHLPANRIFGDRDDVLLLFVDRQRLTAPLRWEAGVRGDPAEMRFPHLYGPLPLAAVVHVARYLRQPDGGYPQLPDIRELSDLPIPSTAALAAYTEA